MQRHEERGIRKRERDSVTSSRRDIMTSSHSDTTLRLFAQPSARMASAGSDDKAARWAAQTAHARESRIANMLQELSLELAVRLTPGLRFGGVLIV
jgi:hypothetical protein